MESDRCPGFTKSWEAGKPVRVEVESTLADGLAVPLVGFNSFETSKGRIDKMVNDKLILFTTCSNSIFSTGRSFLYCQLFTSII